MISVGIGLKNIKKYEMRNFNSLQQILPFRRPLLSHSLHPMYFLSTDIMGFSKYIFIQTFAQTACLKNKNELMIKKDFLNLSAQRCDRLQNS
jgi:hypothetical protein